MIIANGEAIGWRELVPKDVDYSSASDRSFHVVVWTENEDVGFFDQDPGYYCVFRIGYFDYDGDLVAEYAEMFCFYDGKNPHRDDPDNPRIMSKTDAIQYMQAKHPEYEVIYI